MQKNHQAKGYSPSRSIFKLEEIVQHLKNQNTRSNRNKEKLTFLNAGDAVIDLGVSVKQHVFLLFLANFINFQVMCINAAIDQSYILLMKLGCTW